MANNTNNRDLVKRSTISGDVPTIPGSGATNIYDHRDGGWLATDIYVGELFMNVADEKIWFRSTGGTHLLGYSGMTVDFVDLQDTPASYTSANGYGVRVNSGATGLEFYELTGTSFVSMPDTPSDFLTGSTLVSNSAQTGLEWTDSITTFIQLTDCPSSIDAQYLVVGNTSGTALEMLLGSDTYLDKNTVQTINSAKTFASTTTMSGLTLYNTLAFNGQSITEISTDTGFTSATNSQLVTAYATKMYVDSQIFGTGATSFVDLGSNQTITGIKTFNNSVIYNSGFTLADDLTVNANLNVCGTTYNNVTNETYWGDGTTDGSYRMYITPTADFIIGRRKSGIWDDNIFAITDNGVSIGTYTGSTGSYNFTMGYECQANGPNAVAGGSNSQASGSRSFAFGTTCTANGTNTFAIGIGSQASGTSSFAGNGSIVSGQNSFGFSRYITTQTTVSGRDSASIGGYDHTLSHDRSIILGGTGITSSADDTVYMRNLDVSDSITSAGSVGYTGIISIGGTDCQFANGIFIGTP